MSRINTSKITGKVRIRITRPWRGYPVGAVIKPPGALRQMLLQAKDQLGNRVAEIVEEEVNRPVIAKPAEVENKAVAIENKAVVSDGSSPAVRRGRAKS